MDKARPIRDESLRDGPGFPRGRTKKRLIADELERALRDEKEVGEKNTCIREPNFAALYQFLGDRAVQDQIRDANREDRHCKFLIESTNACGCLPVSAGSHAGLACPNNPYERHWALFERHAEDKPLLSQAHYLSDLTELGLLPGPDELSPEDFMIARRMRQRARMEDLEVRQATSISALFGGGE